MKFLITESKLKKALIELIENGGIVDAIDSVGGLENLLKLLPDVSIEKYLIPEIKKMLHDIGGVSPTEIGMENIRWKEENIAEENELHIIDYFGTLSPIVQVWGGYDYGTDYGEYRVGYETLNDNDLYEIYTKLKIYYDGY